MKEQKFVRREIAPGATATVAENVSPETLKALAECVRLARNSRGAFPVATGSVPPLWAVEAGCLILNTYLHGRNEHDMDENDVADIITRRFLAAQNVRDEPRPPGQRREP